VKSYKHVSIDMDFSRDAAKCACGCVALVKSGVRTRRAAGFVHEWWCECAADCEKGPAMLPSTTPAEAIENWNIARGKK